MGLRRGLPSLVLVLAALALHAAPASAAGCREIAVTMSDGVRLDGWFVPAAAGGRAPVLWTMTPYTNTGCPGGVTGMGSELSSRFNIVRLSYRGTGASEGVSDDGGPQTSKDLLDVGRSIVARPRAARLVPAGNVSARAWGSSPPQSPRA